ncbi:DUF6176 family protein [Bacillus spongiae]|uniref:DUF6176 family protein n=1 Tax=Bacillus spongiae TaxID=2683610 RepID=A0ABU8HD30_9BACI
MNVELSKFRVKEGKEEKVTEWMDLLNEHMDDVLLTLKDEKMYIETIFREKEETGEYLYWYSVQGENGISVEESHHEIDKQHIAYWIECIDEEYHTSEITTEVVMIPKDLIKQMV